MPARSGNSPRRMGSCDRDTAVRLMRRHRDGRADARSYDRSTKCNRGAASRLRQFGGRRDVGDRRRRVTAPSQTPKSPEWCTRTIDNEAREILELQRGCWNVRQHMVSAPRPRARASVRGGPIRDEQLRLRSDRRTNYGPGPTEADGTRARQIRRSLVISAPDALVERGSVSVMAVLPNPIPGTDLGSRRRGRVR